MVQTFQMKCKSTVQYEPVMTTMEYARMDRAAKIIQNAWREWYYEQVSYLKKHKISWRLQGGRELRGPVTTRNPIAHNLEDLLQLSSDTKPCIRSAISLPNMVCSLLMKIFINEFSQQVLRKTSHKRDPMEKRSLDSLIKGLKCIRGKTIQSDFSRKKN